MSVPLAHLLRPRDLTEYIGQTHLIGPGKPIRCMLDSGRIASMIFWGPPGCGKTTLASLIATKVDARFVSLSAVEVGIKEIKDVISSARQARGSIDDLPTILFIDEIHRFNKAQQDALLGAVEQGTITLIGATTENPGFSVIAPLISRTHVYILHELNATELSEVVARAKPHMLHVKLSSEAHSFLISYASGDARKLLNALQSALASGSKSITLPLLESILQQKMVRYDRAGDAHYDTISAFIKSMRGSQPDAAVHYLARMITAGEDPLFICRRMVILASEDIGNAQPTALVVATACMQAVMMIGMPEAQIMMSQCAIYLATAKKSTASYAAICEALRDIQDLTLDPIPLHLRNASNKVMKAAGYGAGHIRYPWQEEQKGKKVDQEYMPENLKGKKYYRPDWS